MRVVANRPLSDIPNFGGYNIGPVARTPSTIKPDSHPRRCPDSACEVVLKSSDDQSCETAQASQDPQQLPPTAACGYPSRLNIERGRPLSFSFDGRPIEAYQGETIAAALLASGQRFLRLTDRQSEPRGLFCNMGVCFDCLVNIDGRENQRACQHPVVEGMQVQSQGDKTSSEQQP